MITEVVEHDTAARTRARDRRHRELQCAAGSAGYPTGHPQDARPAAARGRDPRRDVPRASRAHRGRARRPARRSSRSAHRTGSADERVPVRDHPARRRRRRPRRHHHVEPPGRGSTRSTGPCARRWPTSWRIVKLDDSVNAVVLRAAGDRAFSAGLDVKSVLRSTRQRVEPRGSRRAAQPQVAEDVEAGGVRRAGHVHRGRVLLRQRVRRRDLLRRTPRSSTPTSAPGWCAHWSRSA